MSCGANSDCLSTYYCQGGSCLPKLADGETCVSSTDCLSGSCVQGYADTDNDGFGNGSAGAKFCGALPQTPVRYVSNASDCCDSNANVRPNQTNYFSSPITGACSSLGYNYDCSSPISIQHEYGVNGCFVTCSSPITSCTGNGWSGTTYPGCGNSGTLRTCSTGSLICGGGEFIIDCRNISSSSQVDRCR